MVLNYIWVAFILIAFAVATIKLVFWGDTEVFGNIIDMTFDMSKTAFDLSIGLTGTLAFWLGIMNVGEKGGAVNILAKLVDPFFRRIFPAIPQGHPAMSSMVMNFAANMLGLDNAATPLGLKAMKQMQELNDKKDTASDPMIMFLTLNTSGLTLIPISVMVYRAQMGAENPADVFIPILLATAFSTIAGLTIVAIYQRINLFQPVILAYLGGLVALIAFTIIAFSQMSPEQVKVVSQTLSSVILFSIITAFVGLAFYRNVNVYEAFVEGAKGAFDIAITIIPYLVAILVAIGIFRASGSMDLIMDAVKRAVEFIGFDPKFVDTIPVAMMKPLSGSGARGLMVDIMESYGADSFQGRLASTMQGATDTTMYIIAVYFGSVGIKKTRYAVTCGLWADFVGVIAAILISYLFFEWLA
ncbi:nucleoside recognition domain-containing protein [Sediminitomix flava]|uniref:Spore maturation protein SpmA n=1 Tax=Sediminitomix flava TaxID=379075 RepID=A0A315YW81_SEDFL|nr:spore maturation protein [Sediminitomix flava]PWJ34099.1 spore maturation protein SpmA [Sediminitomix flava]